MPNSLRLKKIALLFSLIYAGFYGVIMGLIFGFDLSLESVHLSNALALGMLLLPILPLFWLIYIRQDLVRRVSLGIYSGVLILLSPFLFIALILVLNNALTGNGFRPVFESKLNDQTSIIIYRSPDQGALGGDELAAAKVQSILPGVVRREWLGEEITEDLTTGEEYVEVDGIRIQVPNSEELYERGKLH